MHTHFTRLLFAMLLLGCTLQIRAQSPVQAKRIIERIADRYSQMEAFSLQFTYEISQPAIDFTDQIKGNAFIQGSMYRIALDQQQIACNGQATWTYTQETNEVTITTPDPARATHLQNLFQLHKGKYTYRIYDKKKHMYVIELTPYDKKQELFKMQLHVDTKARSLQRCKMFYKDGSRHTYSIRKVIREKVQPSPYFSFNAKAYENVEVIDLR